jgi:hypothetical protein
MGTSYQTLVVVGAVTAVKDAFAEAGIDGLVLAAGPGRTAVIPREGQHDYVNPARLAELVSARAGFAALSNDVSDSDVVLMHAFRNGRMVHEYISDQAMLVDWFIDDDGTTKFRMGGVEYPADAPHPRGPRGADPAALAPFGVDPIDPGRLGAALRGEFDGTGRVYAEFQHRLILKAMNLDPRGLTTSFRWATPDELPGAARILDARPAAGPGSTRPNEQRLTVMILTGLPLETDPLEAAQVIADAVAGGPLPMRADVGYTAVVPGPATPPEFISMMMRHGPSPRSAVYFVALYADPGSRVPELLATAERRWATALRARYGLSANQGPGVVPVAEHQFEIGFGKAGEYRSSR